MTLTDKRETGGPSGPSVVGQLPLFDHRTFRARGGGAASDFSCSDCGVDTNELDEWYMVRDEVWAAAGTEYYGGKLCIGCLEERLGRRLTPADFKDSRIALCNGGPRHSARLADRLGYRG